MDPAHLLRSLRTAVRGLKAYPLPPRRFALVGCRGMIAETHFGLIRRIGGDLVVGFDLSDCGVQRMGRFFPRADCLLEEGDFEMLLRNDPRVNDIDYFSICTPGHLHAPQGMAALEAGIDVICEKPLTRSMDELEQVRGAVARTGRRDCPIMQARYAPLIGKLKQRFAGQHGERHEMRVHYVSHRGPWYLKSWRGSLDKAG